MSTGSADEQLSGAKIQPLDSKTKYHVPHDMSGGAVGTDHDIDHSRIDPLGSPSGPGHDPLHHHGHPHHEHHPHPHPPPHADSQGVIGREEVYASTKIAPLDGKWGQRVRKNSGLDDEVVDAARIDPLHKTLDTDE